MTDHGLDHDDEFLLRLRAQPRPEFAAALYAKIMSERQPSLFRRFIGPVAGQAARYVVALCLAFAIIAVISPSVRAGMAQTIQTLKQIGGAAVVESNRGWDETHHPTPRAGEPRSVAKVERVGVIEAGTRVPYAFRLPTWTADGAVLTNQVEVLDGKSVFLSSFR